MPYIVTTSEQTTKPIIGGTYLCPVSRRAVATLKDVGDFLEEHGICADRLSADTPIPGAVGPLPDGTVIEVEPLNTIKCPGNPYHGPCGKPAHWRDAAGLTGLYPSGAFECSDSVCFTMSTLMDYNAAQED